MPSALYIISAIAIAGLITVLLRAVPFAILGKLRSSKFVRRLGAWMPVGIMLILAVVTTRNAIVSRPEIWWAAPVALAVTIVVHYATKRKTLWSVIAGTACYVILVGIFG